MEKQLHPVAPTPPASVSAPNSAPAVKVYDADGRDRLALFLAWGVGSVLAALLLHPTLQIPGLGVSALTAAWYAAIFCHRGFQGFRSLPNILLFAATIALASCFALFSNQWLRQYNALALWGLMMIQLAQWSGAGRRPWWHPAMLAERAGLFFQGLFSQLPAWVAAIVSFRKRDGKRRLAPMLAGLGIATAVCTVVLPLLLSADEYFAFLCQRALARLADTLGETALSLAVGLAFCPFLFSLLYALRRPQPWTEQETRPLPRWDAAIAAVTLGAIDALYALFLAVQFSALFGGADYLASVSGVSYAQYARSGFFQLVAVAGINLTLILLAGQFSRQTGGLWRLVQVLSTVMVCMSGAFLVSACYRMSLYVGTFGLSFKRFLTYWGMGMLALLFLAALVKIWRVGFRFFPVALVAGVVGWLLLNFCNVDFWVSRYNVDLYLRQETAVMNGDYLALELSYDALGPLSDLAGMDGALDELVARRQAQARLDAADWRSWSLSAAWAAGR